MRQLRQGFLPALFLSFMTLIAPASSAQDEIPAEEAQEIISALEEADLPEEQTTSWQKNNPGDWQGQWDARVAISELGDVDGLTRLNVKSSLFSGRGRWKSSADGEELKAFTANLDFGNLDIRMGGMGVSLGYGLLVSRPGRSGGLSAGQGLPSGTTKLQGWTTAAEKRSALGMGFSWRWKGWLVTALHGHLGKKDSGMNLSAVGLEKRLGNIIFAVGGARMGHQQGITISGKWERGPHFLGFEWVLWEGRGLGARQGIWLVSWKTTLVRNFVLEAQWAASNGSAGPVTGVRPRVLDAWGGAGWGLRISTRPLKSWRLKLLFAGSQGNDWVGPHQNQSKNFFDLLLSGRPLPGWELSARWHQRTRIWTAWSENYPWLPPALVKEDERYGWTMELKSEHPGRVWVYSLRSLGRQGTSTNGRRTLAGIRHRRDFWGKFSLLISFQSAWGASVDLVSAINPIRGLLLPRHWGHWSSEVLAGVEFPVWDVRIMAALSRREPASGEVRSGEFGFWAGARIRW